MVKSFEYFCGKLEEACRTLSFGSATEQLLSTIDDLELLIASNSHISSLLYIFPMGPIRFEGLHHALNRWSREAQELDGHMYARFIESLRNIIHMISYTPLDEMRIMITRRYQDSHSEHAQIDKLYEELSWNEMEIPCHLLLAHESLQTQFRSGHQERASLEAPSSKMLLTLYLYYYQQEYSKPPFQSYLEFLQAGNHYLSHDTALSAKSIQSPCLQNGITDFFYDCSFVALSVFKIERGVSEYHQYLLNLVRPSHGRSFTSISYGDKAYWRAIKIYLESYDNIEKENYEKTGVANKAKKRKTSFSESLFHSVREEWKGLATSDSQLNPALRSFVMFASNYFYPHSIVNQGFLDAQELKEVRRDFSARLRNYRDEIRLLHPENGGGQPSVYCYYLSELHPAWRSIVHKLNESHRYETVFQDYLQSIYLSDRLIQKQERPYEADLALLVIKDKYLTHFPLSLGIIVDLYFHKQFDGEGCARWGAFIDSLILEIRTHNDLDTTVGAKDSQRDILMFWRYLKHYSASNAIKKNIFQQKVIVFSMAVYKEPLNFIDSLITEGMDLNGINHHGYGIVMLFLRSPGKLADFIQHFSHKLDWGLICQQVGLSFQRKSHVPSINQESFQVLAEKVYGLSPVHAIGSVRGRSFFYHAIMMDYHDSIQYFIHRGAHLSKEFQGTDEHYLCIEKSMMSYRGMLGQLMLLKPVDFGRPIAGGPSIFERFLKNKNYAAVGSILSITVSKHRNRNKEGHRLMLPQHPIFYAIDSQDLRMIDLVKEKGWECSANILHASALDPLQYAVQKGDLAVARHLVRSVMAYRESSPYNSYNLIQLANSKNIDLVNWILMSSMDNSSQGVFLTLYQKFGLVTAIKHYGRARKLCNIECNVHYKPMHIMFSDDSSFTPLPPARKGNVSNRKVYAAPEDKSDLGSSESQEKEASEGGALAIIFRGVSPVCGLPPIKSARPSKKRPESNLSKSGSEDSAEYKEGSGLAFIFSGISLYGSEEDLSRLVDEDISIKDVSLKTYRPKF